MMRVVPLLRASEVRALRGAIRSYRGPFPIPRADPGTDWPDAPLPEDFEMPDEGVTTADHGGGRIGSAAEVTSGASSGHQGIPANVDLRHTSSHPPAAERGDRTNVRAARSMPPVAVPAPKPAIDGARLAAAFMAKPRPVERKARPLQPALSRESCERCGIPGWRGCEHQLPYEAPA